MRFGPGTTAAAVAFAAVDVPRDADEVTRRETPPAVTGIDDLRDALVTQGERALERRQAGDDRRHGQQHQQGRQGGEASDRRLCVRGAQGIEQPRQRRRAVEDAVLILRDGAAGADGVEHALHVHGLGKHVRAARAERRDHVKVGGADRRDPGTDGAHAREERGQLVASRLERRRQRMRDLGAVDRGQQCVIRTPGAPDRVRRDDHAALRVDVGDDLERRLAPVDRARDAGGDEVKPRRGDFLRGNDDRRSNREKSTGKNFRGEGLVVVRDNEGVQAAAGGFAGQLPGRQRAVAGKRVHVEVGGNDVIAAGTRGRPGAARVGERAGRDYAPLAHDGRAACLAYARRTGLPAYTTNTLTHAELLWQAVHLALQQGYALDNEEAETGVGCIGVPVRDASGAMVAGLSISAPVQRRRDEWIPQVVAAGMQLSGRLGYHP